jgi:ATP-dependent Lon protease
MSEMITSGVMPVIALRGLAVFPDQTIHFEVGREKSVMALDAAMKKDQMLMLVPQRDITKDDPQLKDLHPIGTVARVKQILRSTGDSIRVLVTGLCRARIQEMLQTEPWLQGNVISVPETEVMDNLRARALRREANTLYGQYLELGDHQAQAVQLRMMASDNCGFIADSIAQNSGIDFTDKVKLLNQMNPVRRLESALRLLRQELEMLRLETDIQEKTKVNIDQQQKDYYLR